MGRMVLQAVIGLLTIISVASGKADEDVNSSVYRDLESAESAPRLYHQQAPFAVYASAAPHASYSFRIPKVISAPHAASTQLAPVRINNVVIPNTGIYNLRDSYGKFVQTPQTVQYKPAYPQQFVRLQDLPPHLAQPLVSAAAPNFQFKAVPNYFFGPQSYKVPEVQLTGTQYGRFTEPLVYAEDIKSFAPSTPLRAQALKLSESPESYQQTTKKVESSKRINTPPVQRHHEKPEKQEVFKNKHSKYQENDDLAAQLQESQTRVTAIVNGKKTVIKLDTQPPLPLLDINLLEPLKFDNPLVPQIQHFLPRVHSATYHKLSSYDINGKKKPKDITVTKIKTYDSEMFNDKPFTPKKKQTKEQRSQNNPSKPGITVKGHPNSGNYFYEIDTPNHKETYNEQVIKYNKETNTKPVEYTYGDQFHKAPEVYTYVHSSKEPLKVTHVEYNSDDDSPNHQEEQEEDRKENISRPLSQESEESAEDSGEYSDEVEEESPPLKSHSEEPQEHHNSDYSSEHDESPNHTQQSEHEQQSPKNPAQNTVSHSVPNNQYHFQPVPHNNLQSFPLPQYQINSQKPSPPSMQQVYARIPSSQTPYHNTNFQVIEGGSTGSNHNGMIYGSPRQSHHLKAEHRGLEYQQPKEGIRSQVIQNTPKYFSRPVIVQEAFQPVAPEYNGNIRILPKQKPHAAEIKVDPNQHIQPFRPTVQSNIFNQSPAPQNSRPHEMHPAIYQTIPQSSPRPHVYEMSKRIIIKEQEETPDKKHTHTEQVMADVIDEEENSEADFEKAYKESAYGFPAYEQVAEDVEKDIFNPESYGVPRDHNEFSIESLPFQQYQKQGDNFPKSLRSAYKDERDNHQEDYFLDFAVHKPESFTDRIKNKVEYYKMFKNNQPKKPFYQDQYEGKRGKKNEKIIFAPSFDFFEISPKPKKQSKFFAQYKPAPLKLEYDYSREAPQDSVSYASRPYHKYKTHFVEPQFQYGFEPISGRITAESEMSALASNNSPESEKEGTRKKLYKENWYLKKTTTSNKPS